MSVLKTDVFVPKSVTILLDPTIVTALKAMSSALIGGTVEVC